MIKKRAGKWVIIAKTSGRRLGVFDTKSDAQRRLRQIEALKHVKRRSKRGGSAHARA